MEKTSAMRVYNGKIGCMCGCNGKYSTASAFRDIVEKERGYSVSDDEVSDRSVSIIFNKIMKNPKRVEMGNFVSVEENGKIQVVWFAQ